MALIEESVPSCETLAKLAQAVGGTLCEVSALRSTAEPRDDNAPAMAVKAAEATANLTERTALSRPRSGEASKEFGHCLGSDALEPDFAPLAHAEVHRQCLTPPVT